MIKTHNYNNYKNNFPQKISNLNFHKINMKVKERMKIFKVIKAKIIKIIIKSKGNLIKYMEIFRLQMKKRLEN